MNLKRIKHAPIRGTWNCFAQILKSKLPLLKRSQVSKDIKCNPKVHEKLIPTKLLLFSNEEKPSSIESYINPKETEEKIRCYIQAYNKNIAGAGQSRKHTIKGTVFSTARMIYGVFYTLNKAIRKDELPSCNIIEVDRIIKWEGMHASTFAAHLKILLKAQVLLKVSRSGGKGYAQINNALLAFGPWQQEEEQSSMLDLSFLLK